jgi:hypothetical protein
MGAWNRVGIGLWYRPASLHRLAESIPWNRLLGSLNVYKFRLCWTTSQWRWYRQPHWVETDIKSIKPHIFSKLILVSEEKILVPHPFSCGKVVYKKLPPPPPSYVLVQMEKWPKKKIDLERCPRLKVKILFGALRIHFWNWNWGREDNDKSIDGRQKKKNVN